MITLMLMVNHHSVTFRIFSLLQHFYHSQWLSHTEYEKSVLYLLQRHWLISAVFLSFLMYAYGVISGSENVFVTSILRLLPHMTEKPTIPVHLIAFVKEPSVKMDLLVVVSDRGIEM